MQNIHDNLQNLRFIAMFYMFCDVSHYSTIFPLKIAKNHSEEGYNIMFESGYGGEHWLATFAIYNFSK